MNTYLCSICQLTTICKLHFMYFINYACGCVYPNLKSNGLAISNEDILIKTNVKCFQIICSSVVFLSLLRFQILDN